MPPIFFVTDIDNIKPELTYLLDLFASILEAKFILINAKEKIDPQKITISYLSKPKDGNNKQIVIDPDYSFWQQYLNKTLPVVKPAYFNQSLVLTTKELFPSIKKNTNGIFANFDFISSSFFHISRLEEIYQEDYMDKHNRFSAAKSLLKEKEIMKPWINIYLSEIRNWIKEVYGVEIALKNNQPDAGISHDIDIPFFYQNGRAEIGHLIRFGNGRFKYKNVKDVVYYLKYLAGLHEDPYEINNSIEKIKKDSGHNVPSTYFILRSEENEYGLDKAKNSKVLQKVHAEGNEIAIHPGYHSFLDPFKISREIEEVEQLSSAKIFGARNHFLQFKIPDSYRIIEELGLAYDSTLGYADQVGFRAAICTPFKPFDIHNREIIDIIEIPLMVMDGTLCYYQKVSAREAWDKIKKIIDIISEFNGTFVTNWHNTFLAKEGREWQNVFRNTLNYLKEKDFQFCLERDLADKYRAYWKN